MPNDIAVRGLSDYPAECVADLVVHRQLRSSGDREILRRDYRSYLEAAVANLQTYPMRHVLYIRVDIASATEIVRKPLVERCFDAAVGPVAIAFGMIRSGFDGLGCVGGIFHAQRIEQLLTEHRVPIRCAFGLCHNTTGDDVRDVRIGKRCTKTRDRLDVSQ